MIKLSQKERCLHMKRFITVLSGLLVLPAFAEVAPLYYDEIVEYTDDMIDAEDEYIDEAQAQEQTKQNVVQRNTTNRSTTASRAIPASATSAGQRANTSSRAIASSPRSTTGTARGTASRTARTASVVNRAQPAQATRASVTSRGSRTSKPVTARVGTRNNSVIAGSRAGTYGLTQKTLEDSGSSLYNSNTASRVGVNSRRATARISSSLGSSDISTPVISEEAVTSTTNNLTAIAELTDYCKAQYAACMDNYCNVLDDNQGRCSCSKNIKNYAKTEAALATATEQLQEAIQKIKYIGLSSDQIIALFDETEAELTMKDNSKGQDKSKIRSNLEAIRKSVIDVSSPTSSSYDATSGVSWDIDGLLSANFSSADFSIASFLGGNSTNTSSVSNQRGEQLYKTAAARCRTAVLNSCTAQGIDANVITNSYDLEIDKQCIAYERSLNEANTEIKNSISNAAMVLQLGRLKLAQSRNSYDLRGCVAAIDSCMQDEYVCGSDYELCLDPTGKYLANGKIVKGGTPGISGGQVKTKDDLNASNYNSWTSGGMYDLYATWNYGSDKNAWSNGYSENLGGYIDDALTAWESEYKKSKDESTTDNMARYILQKVGYIDDSDKLHGMCASAMKQCQDYTFDTKKSPKKYIAANEVVRMFLTNTLSKIKAQQDTILSEYAEGCRSDVQSCLSTNGYDESNTKSTTSQTAVNACASEIATCMSVGGYKPQDGTKLTLRAMTDWVSTLLISCPENTYLTDNGVGDGIRFDSSLGKSTQTESVVVSCKQCPSAQVFYYTGETDEDDEPEVAPITGRYVKTLSTGGQSTTCYCKEGYEDYYQNPTDNDPNKLGCIDPDYEPETPSGSGTSGSGSDNSGTSGSGSDNSGSEPEETDTGDTDTGD